MPASTEFNPPPMPVALTPLLFKVLRSEWHGHQFVFDGYFSASHVSDAFVDGRTRRELIESVLHHERRPNNLPLGEPNWFHYRVSNGYTRIPGEVVGIRATWPAEQGLPE